MHLFEQLAKADFWIHLSTEVGIGLIKIILTIILYYIAKSIGKRVIDQIFTKYKEKKEITAGRIYTLEKLTLNIYSYALMFVFLVTIFTILDLPIESLLAGAGVAGLAIGFGAQGLVSDIVTGFFILLEKQIDVGEVVTIDTYNGVVEEVGLRTTQLRGFDGVLHFIPNRQIVSVSNHSRGNMRALVDIGIAYSENIDEAIQILQKVCETFAQTHDALVEGPNVLGVQAFNASDITIRVIAHTKNGEQFGVERDLKKAIKDAFDEHDIEMPSMPKLFVDRKQNR
jgi:moderate conductance mechanosensitive channel